MVDEDGDAETMLPEWRQKGLRAWMTLFPYPGGVIEISRGLSEATPPEKAQSHGFPPWRGGRREWNAEEGWDMGFPVSMRVVAMVSIDIPIVMFICAIRG
jgi:hypothetical protein